MSRLLEKKREDRMKEINQKNKEKERVKEREKEARERENRHSNGHLFTSLSVSSTTLCSQCNRSITAKEALSCPGCNVTIHNRCRDSLASCAKMKQKQQKLAMVRNSSALQNVAMRTKTPLMKERPSSAVYASDSIRSSLLGSRRVRTGLLAKSVSSNNITGLGDESVGLRRILSQSTESLNFRSRTLSMESLTDDAEFWWSPLLDELNTDGSLVSADSWSVCVEQKFLQTLHKDMIKQQDVIYELIQTEFHHVRTLRIMEGIWRRGLSEEVGLEGGVVSTIFPVLDHLIGWHRDFLSALMERREAGLSTGSGCNFTVTGIGEVLERQFSGQNAEDMKKFYSEFCSRHPKAVKVYKETVARDRRLQGFIRKVSRGPLMRRHGIQECILLVTQRITKYPVLMQRILDHSKGHEEECVRSSLSLLKDLLLSVDQEVLELERSRRLQEVQSRLDPKAVAEVRGGGAFRGEELLRRRLLHQGALQWKVQGSRLKDVQVLLMSDILVFLQEKDQKYSFASLDKSPIVSLNNLIVREMANQEKGMYLLSSSTPPEMYELHAASKEDRRAWMSLIHTTVNSCPSREDFPLIETEDKALLRRLRADITQKDRELLELLQERVTLFSDYVEASRASETHRQRETQGREEEEKNTKNTQQQAKPTSQQQQTAKPRNLFRADSVSAPQAETLLLSSISEVDKLSELLLSAHISKPSVTHGNKQPVTNGNQDVTVSPLTVNGSIDSNAQDGNGNELQEQTLDQEVRQLLVSLSTQLHALQAAVIRQDSLLELSLSPAPSDASLRRQVEQLQQEVARLKQEGEEPQNNNTKKKNKKNKKKDKERESEKGEQNKRRGSKELMLAPLASEEPLDQSDGFILEEEEEEEVMRISPRSDSPRDLQDIPEEAES